MNAQFSTLDDIISVPIDLMSFGRQSVLTTFGYKGMVEQVFYDGKNQNFAGMGEFKDPNKEPLKLQEMWKDIIRPPDPLWNSQPRASSCYEHDWLWTFSSTSSFSYSYLWDKGVVEACPKLQEMWDDIVYPHDEHWNAQSRACDCCGCCWRWTVGSLPKFGWPFFGINEFVFLSGNYLFPVFYKKELADTDCSNNVRSTKKKENIMESKARSFAKGKKVFKQPDLNVSVVMKR